MHTVETCKRDILFGRKYVAVGTVLFYSINGFIEDNIDIPPRPCSKFHSSYWQDIFSGLPGYDVKCYSSSLETLLIANYFDIN